MTKVHIRHIANHNAIVLVCVVLLTICGCNSNKKQENTERSDVKTIFGNYEAPYTTMHPSTLKEHSCKTIDFWEDDRLNVAECTQCLNMLSNPSFEAGFRYYTFSPAIGTYIPGYEDKYLIDENVSKFGTSSLKILALSPTHGFTFDNIRSFAYPVISGGKYTLSFYAKSTHSNITLKVTHMSDSAFAKEKQPTITGPSTFELTKNWKRYSVTIKSHSTGYGFSFNVLDNVEGGAIWLDGLQLEEGENATEYTEPPVCAILTTSDSKNFLQPNEKINGKLLIKTTKPNQKGTVSVTAKDFLYNETEIGSFTFKTDAHATTELSLPLDKLYFGKKGIFIVKAEISLENSNNVIIDYFRFSIMKKMKGVHRNRKILGYHQLVIPTYKAAMQRWHDIGLGSVNYFYYNFHNKLLFDILKKYGIEDTSAQQRNHWGKSRSIIIEPNGPSNDGQPGDIVLIKDIETWEKMTPAREKLVEQAAFKYAKFYYWRHNFFFAGEMHGYKMLDEDNYDEMAKFLIAWAKGVKKASAKNNVYLEGGAANVSAGKALTENLLRATNKIDPNFRFDRFAVHAYGHPENEELDDLLVGFMDVLDRNGYPDAPVYLNEGGYFAPYVLPEWGLTPYRPYLMDHYHLWAISYDMGWGERVSAALTIRDWLLALKYQDRIKQFNMWRPFIYLDCDLKPMAIQKAANTIANLLGNASFKKEIIFSAKSKAYVFEDDNKTPIAVVWGYMSEVETGHQNPLLLTLNTGGEIVEVLDIMENSREVTTANVTMELPLSPFPVFLKGKKGHTEELINVINHISVKGASIPPIHITQQLMNNKTLKLKVKNLLTRNFQGKLSLKSGKNHIEDDIDIPGKSELLRELKLSTPIVNSSINASEVAYTVVSSDGLQSSDKSIFEGFSIKKANTKISLTGNMHDWDDIPFIPIKNLKVSKPTISTDFNISQPKIDDSITAFKARFKTAWDDQYFYLLVDVTDDKLTYGFDGKSKHQMIYYNDALIVYFDTLCNGKDKSTTRVDSDDYYYVFMPRPEEKKALVYTEEACNQQLSLGIDAVKANVFVKEVKTVFKRTEKGYFYEIAFPKFTILPLQLKSGSAFGFGLFVNNVEQKGKPYVCARSLSSPPGSSCWRQAHLWPQAILTE